MGRSLGIVFALVLAVGSCYSQDRYFARTYNTTVLPKGNIDLEFWHTSRLGHENEFFHAQDQRMELEFGLGRKFQTAFYFNRYQKTAIDSLGNNATSKIYLHLTWSQNLRMKSKKKRGKRKSNWRKRQLNWILPT